MGDDVAWEPARAGDKLSSAPERGWRGPAWPPSVLLWSAPLGHQRAYPVATMSPMSMPLATDRGPGQGSVPRHHTSPPPPPTHSRPSPGCESLFFCLFPSSEAKKCPISSETQSHLAGAAPSTIPPLSPLPAPAAEPPAEALPRLTPAPPALEMIHFPRGNFYYLLIFLDLFQPAPFLSGVTRNHPL